MPIIAPQTRTDPLAAFIAGAFASHTKRSIPLVSTNFEVSIDAGLAIVATRRLFRNDEPNSIEATITFPVPVHATLFALEARIDGRILKARAQRKTQARETYEEGLERGKTAVLHEELLRGVHMLLVGHIPPGAEVEISTRWATTLTIVNGRGLLRIPLTVGDIYGHSGLPDSDALLHGGPVQTAELTVHSSDGTVELTGGRLADGRAQVLLNAPIDLVVTAWKRRDLRGRAADGREVFLRIEPRKEGVQALNIALLIDHSGSMGEVCSGDGRGLTKHEALRRGLRAVSSGLHESDVIDVWEFNNALKCVGSTRVTSLSGLRPAKLGEDLGALLDRLSEPAGGTELGSALSGTLTQSKARDVLLITDGKSYALDVQELARLGRRITVVLVGEDSLEANVGHLAALTGGEIFVVAGEELEEVMATAVGTLRRPCEMPRQITGELRQISAVRGGALVSAEWRPPTKLTKESEANRGVAALAAGLALVQLDAEAAEALAEAEGLVTHLTSLVLVDEAAEAQQGVPAMRKVILPTPRTVSVLGGTLAAQPSPAAQLSPTAQLSPMARASDFCFDLPARGLRDLPFIDRKAPIDLSRIGSQIDWDAMPNRLLAGDLTVVDSAVAQLIEQAAAMPEVLALAEKLKLDAVVLILALLASAHASTSRSAARIASTVLGKQTPADVSRLRIRLGLV